MFAATQSNWPTRLPSFAFGGSWQPGWLGRNRSQPATSSAPTASATTPWRATASSHFRSVDCLWYSASEGSGVSSARSIRCYVLRASAYACRRPGLFSPWEIALPRIILTLLGHQRSLRTPLLSAWVICGEGRLLPSNLPLSREIIPKEGQQLQKGTGVNTLFGPVIFSNPPTRPEVFGICRFF